MRRKNAVKTHVMRGMDIAIVHGEDLEGVFVRIFA